MHKDLSEFDIPQLALHPSSNNFWEHKKCFKKCVKDMKTAFFDEQKKNHDFLQKIAYRSISRHKYLFHKKTMN